MIPKKAAAPALCETAVPGAAVETPLPRAGAPRQSSAATELMGYSARAALNATGSKMKRLVMPAPPAEAS